METEIMFTIPQLWIRLLGAGVCIVLLALFINPMLLGIRNVGCYAGTAGSLLGLVFFAANPWAAKLLDALWENGIGHVVLCVLIGALVLCGVLAFAISVGMTAKILDKPKEEAPVVILGCKVRNGVPSLMLQRRLDAAVPYLKDHPDVPVIVCGGQGPDESISEAQCMKDYLTGKGIAAERIYQDAYSSSTQENLRNAKEILEQKVPETTNIIIVTDGYHQLRASMIAENLRLTTDAISAKTSWYLVPCYWVREWLGVCYQFVFG